MRPLLLRTSYYRFAYTSHTALQSSLTRLQQLGARRCIHNGPPPELDASVKGDALIAAAVTYVGLCSETRWPSRVRRRRRNPATRGVKASGVSVQVVYDPPSAGCRRLRANSRVEVRPVFAHGGISFMQLSTVCVTVVLLRDTALTLYKEALSRHTGRVYSRFPHSGYTAIYKKYISV